MGDELYAGKPGRPTAMMSIVPGGTGTPIPEPPRNFKTREQWDRLWTVGRSWLSNEAHYDLMRLLCEALQDRDRLHRQARRGQIVITGFGGSPQVHPAWKQIDAMDAKIVRLFDQLGFSPQKRRTAVSSAQGKTRLEQLREAKRQA